mmetsp:Transcript_14090/g.60335  ORF Transcript_14090/g.60335 Transcript_14090/m.60335 type:complete len:445 (-) Transcript_14090:342-1676(-)
MLSLRRAAITATRRRALPVVYAPLRDSIRSRRVHRLRGHHLVRRLRGVRLGGGHELPELGQVLLPVYQDEGTLGGARFRDVRLDQSLELRLARLARDALRGDNLAVHLGGEGFVLVQEVPQPARHAGADVPTNLAEHHHRAAGHVLAAVVARALDDRLGQRVAHGEALARAPVDEHASAGGAVQARVARDDAILGAEGRLRRGHDRDLAAGHGLAHVVVRLSLQFHVHAPDAERTEGLARRTAEFDVDGAGEARVAVPRRHGARDARRRRAIHVDDVLLDRHRTLLLERLLHRGILQDLVVQHAPVAVRGLRAARLRGARRTGRREQEREVQLRRLGGLPAIRAAVRQSLGLREQVVAADHLVQGLVPHARQLHAHFLRAELEEVHQIAGRAGETRAELLALRRDAHGAVVGVADARHHAPGGDHRDGTEAVLVRAHQSALDDV